VSIFTRAGQVAVSVTVMLAMASCTPTDNDSSTRAASPTATSDRPGPTPTVIPPTDSTVATTTPAATSTTTTSYDFSIETSPDGEVTVIGPKVIEVNLGSSVDLTISSSIDEVLHIHGYDLFFDLIAGEETPVDFVADVPGIFEVELEGGHGPVFDLEVTP